MKIIRMRQDSLIGVACLTVVLDCLTLAAGHAVAADKIEPRASKPTVTDTIALANEILNRWEPVAVEAGQHSPAWRELFATQLTAMDASVLDGINRVKLRGADDAKAIYAQFTQAVRSAEMQSYMLAQSGKGHIKLGSASTDQVFIPLAPCRIVDTRNAGGPIAAGTTRNFYFYANAFAYNWANQGGVNGLAGLTCPGTLNPNGGAPSAAVITVTVVSPTAAGNWIVWGGANPIPTASALNWNAGQVLANTTVAPAGGRSGSGPGGAIADFAVTYNGPTGSAHFVADVVGYLAENQATALDCYETPVVSATVPSSSITDVVASACATGWAPTQGNCDFSGYIWLGADGITAGAWKCRFAGYGGGTGYASSICCRLNGL